MCPAPLRRRPRRRRRRNHRRRPTRKAASERQRAAGVDRRAHRARARRPQGRDPPRHGGAHGRPQPERCVVPRDRGAGGRQLRADPSPLRHEGPPARRDLPGVHGLRRHPHPREEKTIHEAIRRTFTLDSGGFARILSWAALDGVAADKTFADSTGMAAFQRLIEQEWASGDGPHRRRSVDPRVVSSFVMLMISIWDFTRRT